MMKTLLLILCITIFSIGNAQISNCDAFKNLGSNYIYSGSYQASNTLQSQNFIDAPYVVSYRATNEIVLNYDFEVTAGAEFEAIILECGLEIGCCLTNPLLAPFLQFYTNPNNAAFVVYEGKDDFGNCFYTALSDYYSTCGPIIADIQSPYFDCNGNMICESGFWYDNCFPNHSTFLNGLSWEVIYSCE